MDATTTTNATKTNLLPTPITPRLIVCGDFNSLPKSAVHEYLVRGVVNAKQVAPWYCNPPGGQVYYEAKDNIFHLERSNTGVVVVDPTTTTTTMTTTREGVGHGKSDDTYEEGFSVFASGSSNSSSSSLDDSLDQTTRANEALSHDPAAKDTTTTDITTTMKNLSLSSCNDKKSVKTEISTTSPALTETIAKIPPTPSPSPPPLYPQDVRYMLDYTLNRFCRWLRILGFDATLETEELEKLRTKEGKLYVP
jgi:hypothetical protein